MALRVQNFLGRLPIGFNVVILSPHGFFGQANVLGKPDTGGQVCTCHDLCVLVLKVCSRCAQGVGLQQPLPHCIHAACSARSL